MKLADLEIDEGFIVDSVDTEGEIRQRIIEMGFTPGAIGRIVRKAPLGDPIQVHIMDYEISLRKNEAQGINVVKENSKADIKLEKSLNNQESKKIEINKKNGCVLNFLHSK